MRLWEYLLAGAAVAWAALNWRRNRRGDRTHAWLGWAAVAAGAAKLWLASGQAQYALPADPYDDRLFLRLATYLLQGRWLGPYDELTLAKGPFYPLFLAASSTLRLPITVAQNLLYIAAAWLLVLALRPLRLRGWLRLLLLLAILLCPALADTGAFVRAWRQAVWPSLVLLSFAGTAGLSLRMEAGARSRAAWSLLLGLSLGAVWLDREEAAWVLPMLAFPLVFAALRSGRLTSLVWLCAPFAIAALCVSAVALQNFRAYRFGGIVEFRDDAFVSAYGAISRVEPHDSVRRIPVTWAARERIYAVSPAFSSLRGELEGGIGASFMKVTQDWTGIPASEHEIGGGWMIWALRAAVANTGHAHSAPEARAFYAQLAREVNAACDDGRLPAGPQRRTLRPVWPPGGAAAAWRSACRAYRLIRTCPYRIRPIASIGSPEDLAWVERITGEPVAPANRQAAAAMAGPRRLAVLGWTLWAYRATMPWLLPSAGVLWCLSLARGLRRRELSLPWVLAGAILLGIVGNLAVVALVDALSFGAVNPGYLGASVPLAVAFVGIVLAEWAGIALESRWSG